MRSQTSTVGWPRRVLRLATAVAAVCLAPVASAAAAGQVSGRVTDAATHQALADVSVQVFRSTGSFVASGVTDTAGRYTVGGLGAGGYKVWFSAADDHIGQYYNAKASQSTADAVTLASGQMLSNIDAALQVGGQISGTVTDAATGGAVASTFVEVFDSQGRAWAEASTDQVGRYLVGSLPSGSYTVSFSGGGNGQAYGQQFFNGKTSQGTADPVSVTVGLQTQNVNAGMRPAGMIAGAVTVAATNAAPAAIEVDVYDMSGTFVAATATDANGRYSIGGLTTGSYKVGFLSTFGNADYAPQYYNTKGALTTADPVAVTSGQTTANINAALGAGGRIAGTVSAAGTQAAIHGIEVDVYDAAGRFAAATTTDATGGYAVGGLGTASYKIGVVDGTSGVYIPEFYSARPTIETADGVSVTGGVTTPNINFAMHLGGSITGVVTDALSGAPASSVDVSLYDASGALTTSGSTDAAGRYAISGLATGDYRVDFTAAGGLAYDEQFYNTKTTLVSANPVTVTAGQTSADVNAAMQGGGVVRGTVTDAKAHAGVGGVYVYLYDLSGGYVDRGITDASGHYVLGGIAAGAYDVAFYDPSATGGYLEQFYNGKATLAAADPISVAEGHQTTGVDAALEAGAEITGTVADASTHAPVSGVLIEVYDANQVATAQAQTDSSGHYTALGLPGGTYRVGFFTGAGRTNSYVTQFYNGKSSLAAADGLTVTPGQTVQNVDASMTSSGQITGTVTDASTAAGVAGAAVTVFDAVSQTFIGSAQTDAGGHYTVGRLSTGNYKVSFSPPAGSNYVRQFYNGQASYATADTVGVTVGQTVADINAAFAPGAQISGSVTAADTGAGLSGVQVYAYGANQAFSGSAQTDSAGHYTLGGLLTGSYKIQFDGFGGPGNYVAQYYKGKSSFGTADPVSATAGQTVNNVDAALARGAQISGIITDAATTSAVAGVQVTVYDASQQGSTGPTGSTGVQTDSTGHYTVNRLPAGRYAVGFNAFSGGTTNYLPQFYNAKSTLAAADPLTLAAGQTVPGVNAALAAGGQITGIVTDAVTAAGVANVQVLVYDAAQRFATSAQTNSAGRYTASRLVSGAYRVAFNAFGSSSAYAAQYYDRKSSLAEADPVSVTAGQTVSNVDAALLRKGQITGTVTDASTSAGVSGINVSVYDLSRTFVRSAVTDAAGNYTVGGLAGGGYKVGFSVASTGGGYVAQFYNGKSTYGAADAVTVAADQTTGNVNASLTPAAQIAGTVTDAGTGAAVAGIQVTAYGAGQSFSGAAQTDSSGHYTLSGLADGSYKVGFATFGARNYLPQYYSGKASLSAADSVATAHAAPAQNINAALLPGGQIAGTVTDTSTHAAVVGAQVTVYDSNQTYVTSSQTDANGQYTASGLPSGVYREQIYDPAGDHLEQFYNAKTAFASADQIAVTAGQATQGVDPALAPAGKISGTVTDTETSAGIPGIAVYVYDAGGGGFVTTASTNGAGRFTAGALPGGNYKVGFAISNGTYGAQYYNARASFGTADAVAVTVAQTTPGVDARLTPLPVNTSLPTVSGRAQQDETLTEQPGTWAHNPTGFAYQWERCSAAGTACEAIGGAAANTYVLSSADVGFRVLVVETATNAGGSVSATSAATGVVVVAPPKNFGSPVIAGTAQQGETLTEQRGTWTNQPTSYAVQWLQCDAAGTGCTAIASAASQTYVPGSGDVGHRLEVRETATNAGGPGAPADSRATAIVTPPVPASADPPTISGSAKQGQSLTEGHGTWTNNPTDYAYQWSRCDAAGANCADIAGASLESFGLTGVDVGHTLVVTETASNDGGAGSPARSQPTSPVEAVPPANSALPTVSGTPQQGQTLTEAHGSWTNDPTAYSYSWSRCDDSGANCSALGGATGQTYVPVADDVGHRLVVSEIATNAGGPSPTAASAPTAVIVPPIPTNLAPPAISGSAVQGETLTERRGSWTDNPTGYTYQWSRCDAIGTACLPIQGAIGQTFLLTEADVGHALNVEETAGNAGGSSLPVTSSQTASVVAAPPVSQSPPTISGTAQQGEQLTEAHGSWSNSPTSYSYEWQRCDGAGVNCASVPTATNQVYVLGAGDVGSTLRVVETAGNAAGPGTPAASPATAVVIPPIPSNTAPPTITGTAAQGETLSAARGSWTNDPTSYEYQWLRCGPTKCVPISGATAQTYATNADDVGDTLEVQETAANPGGRGAAAVSARTFAIRPVAPVSTSPPSISGVARQGATLTAIPGAWTNSPTGYAYAWFQCDPSAANCAEIPGATGKTYLLPAGAVGHTIHVQEAASNPGGAGAAATSSPTGVVSGPAPVANAGDPIQTVAGASITLDGASSTPAAAIDDYQWDFGDRQTGNGATVTHVYATPGTYTATLTVTAAGVSDSASTKVTVGPTPTTPGVAVQVTGGGSSLPGADALIILSDGTRIGATTDSSGTAHLAPVPDGSYTVYAWADGYRPGTAKVQVQGGVGSASVDLVSGQVVSATLQSRRLDRNEIIAAGIDPNDPANQNVYQFAVHLAFVDSDVPFSGYVNAGGFVGAGGGGGGWACSPGSCTGTFGGYRYTVSVHYVDGRPTLVWLVIPGKAGFLKEFFDVTMVIQNLADPAFTFAGGQASLNLPTGLSLAPTSTPQRATQTVKDIAGGDTATTTWVVRGDTEGDYLPTATYAATLQPIGTPVSIQAGLDKPVHVWGGSALKMTVDADATAIAHHPYRVRIGLTNVADIPIYNPSVALLETGRVNYIYQPRERLDQGTDAIAPGETFWANYVLVPEISGELDLARSFIQQTAGNVTLKSSITSHPAVDPLDLKVTEMKNKIGLSWVPVPGATDYAVYTTPNPDTAFGPAPAAAEMLSDDNGRKRAIVRNVPDGSTAWYAVSPIVDGQPVMSHPLVPATPSTTVNSPTVDTKYSWPSDSEHMCAVNGVARGTITYTFRDEFFAVSDYVITKGGVVQTKPAFTPDHTVTATVDVSLIDGQTLTVTAQPTNSDGDKTFVREIHLDTKCEQQTAVVVAMGLFSSLGTDGSDAPPGSPSGWLSQGCSGGPSGKPDTTGTDGFNDQVAVNACDGGSKPTANLLGYLRSKGYDPGAKRSDPNRTMLEFSYNGAVVDCPHAGPTFTPLPYESGDTVKALVGEVSVDGQATASGYLDGLEAYNDCWKLRHGRSLEFTVIGHSLGGYEALQLARVAASRGRDAGLIRDIVTVDGAIQQYMVPFELQAGDCKLPNDSWAKLPADVTQSLLLGQWTPSYQAELWALHKSNSELVKQQIQAIQAAGIDVATVTNHYDTCLHEDATINDAANQTAIFRIQEKGWTGVDAHGAALRAHRLATEDPGYPLTSFLDSTLYVIDQGVYFPRETGSATTAIAAAAAHAPATARSGLSAARRAATTGSAAGGRIQGRVLWADTRTPVPDAHIVAVGGDPLTDGSGAADGTFAIESLAAGAYKLHVASASGKGGGVWVGGPSEATATAFPVGQDTVDAGDVLIPRPVRLSVSLQSPGGTPVSDGVALLFDAANREAAVGEADSQGRVMLTAPAGTYTLATAAASTKTLTRTVDLASDTSVQVVAPAGLAVGGALMGADGAPLPDVMTALYSGAVLQSVGFSGANGRFSFVDVAAGDYSVRLFEPLDRFVLPSVELPVTATPGDPAAGRATFEVGHTPVLVPGTPPGTALVSVPYTFDFTASGASDGSFTIHDGKLPDGLTLSADGHLRGTPRTPGVFKFRVSVANSSGATGGGPFGVVVDEKPTFSSAVPPDGRVGSPYAFTIQAAGSPPPSFAVTSGSLPAGLTLDRDGSLHGTPSSEGSSSFAVTATNAVGSATSTYALRVVGLPASTAPPTVSGTVRSGETLTEANGSWTNRPTSFAYQWQDCDASGNACAAVAGATGGTYVLVAGDVGHTIRVAEVASNGSGAGLAAWSAATAVVVPPAPVETSPPTIAGVATQGGTLTEANGSWTNAPTSFAYQWEVCDSGASGCAPIPAATGQTYVLTSTDVGHTVRVQESAGNAGGSGIPVASAATGVVAAATIPTAPAVLAEPSVSGVPAVGGGLSCSPGSWSGTTPQTYAYEWLRDGAAVPGATGGTYAVGAADAGHSVACRVTAANSVGSGTATSAPVSVPIPVITSRRGLASLGRVLAGGTDVVATLACAGPAGATCVVVLEMTVTETVRAGRLLAVVAAKRKPVSTRRTISVGTRSTTLGVGRSSVVHVALNAAGRRLLATRHRLAVTFTASQIGITGSRMIAPNQTVTLTTGGRKSKRAKSKRKP